MSSEKGTIASESEILALRANTLFSQSRYQDALACLHALEANRPDGVRLLSNLGIVYRDSGDSVRAERYFRRVCAALPNDSPAHFNLAVTLLRAGKLREGFTNTSTAGRCRNSLRSGGILRDRFWGASRSQVNAS
jgi:Flp pilus assembly protein TadD